MFRRKTAKSPAGSEKAELAYIGDRIVVQEIAEIRRVAAERDGEKRRREERIRLVYDQLVLELRALVPNLAPFGVDGIHIDGEDDFAECYFCPRATEHVTLLGGGKQILDMWVSSGVSIMYRAYRTGGLGAVDLLSPVSVGAIVEDALSAIIGHLAQPFRLGNMPLQEVADA